MSTKKTLNPKRSPKDELPTPRNKVGNYGPTYGSVGKGGKLVTAVTAVSSRN